MSKKMVVNVVLFSAVAAVAICAVVWRSWSRRYIIEWRLPFRSEASNPVKKLSGNVCIVQQVNTAEPLACADVYLFPHIYSAIGVDEQRMVEWQNENGFDSGGVDRSGALLAPGYPIFSRLAWTIVDPVYLEGPELSELLEESKRVAKESNDPVVRANLDKLSALAERAQAESKVLRFS